VGIDRGFVIEGNIGSYFKKDFTIIGDVVNMASRIEKLSRRVDAHIICSEQIKQSCQHINMRSLGAFRVRGVDDKIEVFTPSNSDQA
jgi:adenylate cyclase